MDKRIITKNLSKSKYEKERLMRREILFDVLEELGFERKCFICNKIKGCFHIHHIDKNHANNKIHNLMILCPSCHLNWHKQYNKIISKTEDLRK